MRRGFADVLSGRDVLFALDRSASVTLSSRTRFPRYTRRVDDQMRLTEHGRVAGKVRDEIAAGLWKDYEHGTSPRTVAESVGRLGEFVHRYGPW
ncbi:MAG: helix-turn-helix domain-containing protein [Pseudonocardiaceae bacterium]